MSRRLPLGNSASNPAAPVAIFHDRNTPRALQVNGRYAYILHADGEDEHEVLLGLLEALDLEVGDLLSFDVAGQRVEAPEGLFDGRSFLPVLQGVATLEEVLGQLSPEAREAAQAVLDLEDAFDVALGRLADDAISQLLTLAEAEARRVSRFFRHGHTAGPIDVTELDAMSSRPRREYPRTLDLRRWPSDPRP